LKARTRLSSWSSMRLCSTPHLLLHGRPPGPTRRARPDFPVPSPRSSKRAPSSPSRPRAGATSRAHVSSWKGRSEPLCFDRHRSDLHVGDRVDGAQAWPDLGPGDLEIVVGLQIQPVLRRLVEGPAEQQGQLRPSPAAFPSPHGRSASGTPRWNAPTPPWRVRAPRASRRGTPPGE
jgi:hypothetical protein